MFSHSRMPMDYGELGIWAAIGLGLFLGGKSIVYMAENYQNDHIYNDKKARIFKILEIITITLAIYFIIFLLISQLSRIAISVMGLTSIGRYPIILIVLASAVTWSGFYAYGAYNTMFGSEVKKRKPKLFILPIIFAIGMMFAVPYLVDLLPYSWRRMTIIPPLFDDWQRYTFTALVIIGAPIFEELAFRKNLLPGLIKTFGRTGTVAASTFAFAIAHGNVPQLIPTLLLGAIAGYVYLQSGSVIYCIILHALYNTGVFLVIPNIPGLSLGVAGVIGGTLILVSTGLIFSFHKQNDEEDKINNMKKRKTPANANLQPEVPSQSSQAHTEPAEAEDDADTELTPFEAVATLVVEKLGEMGMATPPGLGLESRLVHDLGLSTLDVVSIIQKIEATYGLPIPMWAEDVLPEVNIQHIADALTQAATQ
jgi:membrane protease YdiL (CAAX protease family)/acyl carrier protein